MKKAEVIAAMAEQAEITKKQAELALAALEKSLVQSVIDDGKFALPGIGIFTKKRRAASNGVMKGVKWTKDAHNAVTFKASAGFKESVN